MDLCFQTSCCHYPAMPPARAPESPELLTENKFKGFLRGWVLVFGVAADMKEAADKTFNCLRLVQPLFSDSKEASDVMATAIALLIVLRVVLAQASEDGEYIMPPGMPKKVQSSFDASTHRLPTLQKLASFNRDTMQTLASDLEMVTACLDEMCELPLYSQENDSFEMVCALRALLSDLTVFVFFDLQAREMKSRES